MRSQNPLHRGLARLIVAYFSFWARVLVALRRPRIIAITGSAGKTTTATMLTAVLEQPAAQEIVGTVAGSMRNMNDDLGVPMTILRYDDWLSGWRPKLLALLLLPFRVAQLALTRGYPRLLVLEYGTHWKGHLHRLVRVARPSIGIVTTIGAAHLERLKTIEGVVQEKSAVVRAVPPSGLVVLGTGHDHVDTLERLSVARVIKVDGRGVELSRAIATVVARELGIAQPAIDSALRAFETPPGRLNMMELAGVTVIDDSYNANPLSVKLALDTLTQRARPGQRRIALLGEMGELGQESRRYHEEIGDYADSHSDVVIGVGGMARHYAPAQWYDNSQACAEHIEELVHPGDCLLVKGSSSVRMNRIVAKLRDIDRH